MTSEDEMVGWHHRLNRHEFKQALGVGEGQGGLVCCSSWGHKEPDTTERLNNNNTHTYIFLNWFTLKEYSLNANLSLLLPKHPTSHHTHIVLIAVDH